MFVASAPKLPDSTDVKKGLDTLIMTILRELYMLTVKANKETKQDRGI
jgi:hypothetical protein